MPQTATPDTAPSPPAPPPGQPAAGGWRPPSWLISLLAGLTGVGLTALWIMADPQAGRAIGATAQFEQFTQRNACGQQRTSHNATLLLRATAPETLIKRTKALVIDDPALKQPLVLKIEPLADSAADTSVPDAVIGRYVYPRLFNGKPHREQWRPYCLDGQCQLSVLYYADRLGEDVSQAPPRDIRLLLQTDASARDGETSGDEMVGYYERAAPPSADAAAAPDYPPITGRILPDLRHPERIEINIASNYRLDALIRFQINDARGYRETQYRLGDGVIGPNGGAEPLYPPVHYAAAFMLGHDPVRNRNVESKLELINDKDSFFDCTPAAGTGY